MRSFILLVCLAYIGSVQAQRPRKIKVMILGVFHFVSNNDNIKTVKEDMLTSKRQAEIDGVNESLAKFAPDKIFLEWRPERQSFVDSTYQEYINGNFQLTSNEIYQIGYKLGKKLNHQRLFCMDAPGYYLFDSLSKAAKQFGQGETLSKMYDSLRNHFVNQDAFQKLLTVEQRLYQMNRKSGIMENHYGNAGVGIAPYVGVPGNYAGADFMGEWYKRNIRMYSNIVRNCDAGDKSILVIVGAGHARIIRHFFEDNPQFEVVEVNQYLSGKSKRQPAIKTD